MLFFNTKAKRAKELAAHILTQAEKLADGLLAAFDAKPTEKYRKAFIIESLLLFLHLVGRIGDRELNNSQNNGLMNLLAKTIADFRVTSVESIRSKKEQVIASRDFFDLLNRTEAEYSMCTEGFLESEPFSEKALFSKFAQRIVSRKNTIQSEKDSPKEAPHLHTEMSIVLDILLKLYPEMNLEHQVIRIGRSF